MQPRTHCDTCIRQTLSRLLAVHWIGDKGNDTALRLPEKRLDSVEAFQYTLRFSQKPPLMS